MKDLMGLMKQAQAMQQKMAEAQSKLDEAEVTGEAGAGLITVTMTAKGDMKALPSGPAIRSPRRTTSSAVPSSKAVIGSAPKRMRAAPHSAISDTGIGAPP